MVRLQLAIIYLNCVEFRCRFSRLYIIISFFRYPNEVVLVLHVEFMNWIQFLPFQIFLVSVVSVKHFIRGH